MILSQKDQQELSRENKIMVFKRSIDYPQPPFIQQKFYEEDNFNAFESLEKDCTKNNQKTISH